MRKLAMQHLCMRVNSSLSFFLGSVSEMLNSADMAYLLTGNTLTNVCGRAFLNTVSKPYGIGRHQCSRGHYTFGHELGHIMGLKHNIESSSVNNAFPYGYGYLMQPPGATSRSGYRTIMA